MCNVTPEKMERINEAEKVLIEMVVPAIVMEHFELVKVERNEEEKKYEWESGKKIEIFLEEKNTVPYVPEHTSQQKGVLMESKGFYPEVIVQDYPIQGHKVFLHIKRRRWREKETKKEIMREWTLVQEGTKYTKDFASFLKEAFRR